MPATLDAVVALHKTLNQLAAAQARLDTIPDWMRELHEEHSQRRAEIEAAAAVAAEAASERREAEAVAADSEQRLKQFQEQIGRVSTQREYGALLKEIDTAKEVIRKAEQTALEALEKSETSKAQQAELEERFKELDERYQAELGKWESEKPAVARAIEELTETCERQRAQVPRGTLSLFERIYERYRGQALARVRQTPVVRGNPGWHCEACSFNVRPQTVVEIRAGQRVNLCESCKRILFWEDEEDQVS